jgi:hypothetical protein
LDRYAIWSGRCLPSDWTVRNKCRVGTSPARRAVRRRTISVINAEIAWLRGLASGSALCPTSQAAGRVAAPSPRLSGEHRRARQDPDKCLCRTPVMPLTQARVFFAPRSCRGRSEPHLGGSGSAKALVRYAEVRHSLMGVRIRLMIPRYMLLLRGHLVVSGLSTWWGKARFLTVVRGTPIPGY